MDKYKLYQHLPYFFKEAAVSYQGLVNKRKRKNGLYAQYIQTYKHLWHASAEEILKFQKEKLTVLLSECVQYSDWYKTKAVEQNIQLKDIHENPYAVLKQFPFLTKEERRKFPDAIVNNNPNRKLVTTGYTSGTTGSPTINYNDQESLNIGFALWSRFHYMIGLPEETCKNIRFSGRIMVAPNVTKPPFWIYNFVEKQLLMSSYHLHDRYLKYYVQKMNEFKPVFIDGYPSSIYVLADYIQRSKLKISFTLKAIATTAETLYDYQRKVIEEVFNCKVYNQYASSEGGPFITECIKGNLHLNTDSGIFEFINPNGKAAQSGEIAELVITSLRSYKVPLIRYAIKDLVELSMHNIECTCGCKMPVISKIIGREDDLLWTSEKGYVGRMDTAYKGLAHIIKSQIIQKSPGLVEINNIIDDGYDKNIEEKFIKNLRERLGNSIEIKFNYVDDIPLGKTGKFDAVKREFLLP